jgi:hypothetical protein
MDHCMIDLETLNTTNNSIFLSLAAVEFDLATGETGETFKRNITLKSALSAGLDISESTLLFWLEQRPEIMKRMFMDPEPLVQVLGSFDFWFKHCDLRYVWGNSARFDLGILFNGYEKVNGRAPWNHRDERDYRTINSLFGLYAECIKPDPAQAHDPLYDCMIQIERLCKIWSFINPFNPEEKPYRWEGINNPDN